MFQGRSSLVLDAKGRLAIPTKYRDALIAQAEGCLTLTRHPDGCLLMYPRPIWLKKQAEIASFPMAARGLQRLLLGSAQDVDLDAAGRILIAPELREVAHLDREVVMMGIGEHFEIWNTQMLHTLENQVMEQGLPTDLVNFSF